MKRAKHESEPARPGLPLYVVVMAGGRGERFWPLSRRRRPKQLLPLVSERPLVAETVARVLPLVPPERMLVVTGEEQLAATRAALPELPAGAFLVEPAPRNTAPCVALAATVLARRHGDVVMAVLPADHHVAAPEKLRTTLALAARRAEQGHVVTIGITPTRPETGYGYLRLGEPTSDAEGVPEHPVLAFVEKPDAETARRYLAAGCYRWNSGMFVFATSRILAAYGDHLPRTAAALSRLAPHVDTPRQDDTLRQVWPEVDTISIDHGVMEKLDGIRCLAVELGWSDVGSFEALWELAAAGATGNATSGPVTLVGAEGCYVRAGGGRRVVVVGASDLVVVDTDDALLVVPRACSQQVREVAPALTRDGAEDLL